MDVRTVALCLAFAFSVALAQEARHPANERAAMLETMPRGKDINGSRERYQHLPELLREVVEFLVEHRTQFTGVGLDRRFRLGFQWERARRDIAPRRLAGPHSNSV